MISKRYITARRSWRNKGKVLDFSLVLYYSLLMKSMLKKLSRREEETLKFIRSYVVEHGYMPTIREISQSFGYKDTHTGAVTVQYFLRCLEKKGRIRRGRGWRNITLISNQ